MGPTPTFCNRRIEGVTVADISGLFPIAPGGSAVLFNEANAPPLSQRRQSPFNKIGPTSSPIIDVHLLRAVRRITLYAALSVGDVRRRRHDGALEHENANAVGYAQAPHHRIRLTYGKWNLHPRAIRARVPGTGVSIFTSQESH